MAICTRENTPSFFDLQSRLHVEENHAGASRSTHTNNKMLYIEATNMSKTKGTKVVLTTVPDPPEVGGVNTGPKTGRESPPQNASIVARKAIGRVSARRSTLIWIDPD